MGSEGSRIKTESFSADKELEKKIRQLIETLDIKESSHSKELVKIIEIAHKQFCWASLSKEEWKENIQKPSETTKLSVRSELEDKALTHLEEHDSNCWCPYGSYLSEKDKIYCDNPKKKTLPKDRLVSPVVCYQCFQRKEWVKKQRVKKVSSDLVFCGLRGSTISIKEIPCRDSFFKCPNLQCLSHPSNREPASATNGAVG